MWIKGYIVPLVLLLATGAATAILFLIEAENHVGLLEIVRRALHEG